MYYKQKTLKNIKKSHIIHNSAKNVEKIHKMVYNEVRIVVVNMKKLIKVIYIILIVLTLVMCFQMINDKVYATEIVDPDDYDPTPTEGDTVTIETGEDEYGNTITETYTEEEYYDQTALFNKAKIIVALIRNIGIVVSVIALMLIGIRAMVGSAEEKADYQKSLPGYLMGAVLVFAMTMIPSIIYNALK